MLGDRVCVVLSFFKWAVFVDLLDFVVLREGERIGEGAILCALDVDCKFPGDVDSVADVLIEEE